MTKKTLNTPVEISPPVVGTGKASELPALADKAIFSPTSRMRQIKAKFWNRFQSGPFSAADSVSLSLAQQVTGSSSLRAWWSKEGFREWFLNQEEAREETESMYLEALSAVKNDVLYNPDANANAKVNLLKLLAEITGRLTKGKTDRYADEAISNMNENQLRAYVQKKMASLGIAGQEEIVVDVDSSETQEERTTDDCSSTSPEQPPKQD